jgi:hypothetical protein
MTKTKDDKKNNMDDNDNGSSVGTSTKNVEWSPENEMIIVEWCDVAQCYKWLNTRAHNKYAMMHAWFTIPAITLSTISGTASFAQASLPLQYQTFAPMIIGSINILIGILTTIQQYLKISELNEAHRVSAISWDKFARNIRIELAKAPVERMDAGHFLKLNRQEFDRLMETSPSIPIKIIDEFNKTFSGKPGTEQRQRFDALKKPDICDIIITSNESRHHWYKDLRAPTFDPSDNIADLQARETVIQTKVDEIIRKEQEEKEKERKRLEQKKHFALVALEVSNKIKLAHDKIDAFVTEFENMNGRRPMNEEIISNFSEEIAEDILKKYLDKYTNLSIDLTDYENNV